MSDPTWASITIGGDLKESDVAAMAALIGREFGYGVGDPERRLVHLEAEIRAAAAGGKTLTYSEDEADYGRFEIEDELEALGLAFDVSWGAGIEFPEGEDCVRPGQTRRSFATVSGDRAVMAHHVERVLELIGQDRVPDAVDLLGWYLGRDVADVPPLRIVAD